jgi:hypothetical protein
MGVLDMQKDQWRENNIEKLKWAIGLSREGHPDTLSEGDWMKRKHDLWDFVYGSQFVLQGKPIVYGQQPYATDP